MPDDKTLVRAVIGGEQAAYEKLYDRYAPLVRAICHGTTGNLTEAHDLAQDVFMRAYEKLDTLRKPDSFGTWLVGIARLRCREWLRQSRQISRSRVELDDAKVTTADPPDGGRADELWKMIRKLPEKERLALHVFYLHGNSAESARRIMGLSRSGFYRVLERARGRLEQLISGE